MFNGTAYVARAIIYAFTMFMKLTTYGYNLGTLAFK
jgi:hypothetical protein